MLFKTFSKHQLYVHFQFSIMQETILPPYPPPSYAVTDGGAFFDADLGALLLRDTDLEGLPKIKRQFIFTERFYFIAKYYHELPV